MFKKMLAKLGKGSAQIDLILDQDAYALGDEMKGQIHIKGGTVPQKINKIEVDLNMSLYVGEKVFTQLIHRFEIPESFDIDPSEEKSYPFHFQVPYNLLISGNAVSYYFITHLDIDSGKDSSDRDHLMIHPHTRMKNIFTALGQLGFIETKSSRNYDGYFQEFELVPMQQFKDEVEEIELNVITQDNGILLLLEVDCYTLFGERETSREIWLDHALLDDIDALANHLRQNIEEIIQDPAHYHGEKKRFQKQYYLAAGAVGGIAVGLVAAEFFDDVIDEIGDFFEDDDNDDEEDLFEDDDD